MEIFKDEFFEEGTYVATLPKEVADTAKASADQIHALLSQSLGMGPLQLTKQLPGSINMTNDDITITIAFNTLTVNFKNETDDSVQQEKVNIIKSAVRAPPGRGAGRRRRNRKTKKASKKRRATRRRSLRA